MAGSLDAMLSQFLLAPFHDPAMRRSLAAILALALSAGPIGVFLMLRRMSLIGDAMSHAILPGVAIGFLAAGLNVYGMTLGGLVAGLVIALAAGAISRATALQEDASLAVFLLLSLALGVVIVTLEGMDIEQLMTFLFGETSARMSGDKLLVIAVSSTISLLALALIYRPLVLGSVDPGFLRAVSRTDSVAHLIFLALLVLNLVSGFHALGTLLGVGIIIIPAGIARFWTRDLSKMIALAVISALISGYAGLLFAFHAGIPSGPAVTLAAGLLYIGSVVFGPVGGLIWRAFPGRHLEA
jgi:zinc/manganese transport system permease protein